MRCCLTPTSGIFSSLIFALAISQPNFSVLSVDAQISASSRCSASMVSFGSSLPCSYQAAVMTHFGPHALFAVTAVAHLIVVAYSIIRSRIRAARPREEKDNYTTAVPGASAQLATPEGLKLDPRATGSTDRR